VVRDGARGGQPTAAVASANTAPNRLVEAQGWIIGADGKVILTAQAPLPHLSILGKLLLLVRLSPSLLKRLSRSMGDKLATVFRWD
jgi:hypothetical protein